MRRVIAATFIVLLLATTGIAAGSSALAQGAFNLMVYPAKLEIAATPGTTQEFAINVRNLGDQPETMSVYFNDYFIKANNEFVFEEPGHYSYSCANWLSTDTPAMVVPPGQVASKVFSLAVPQSAEPGGHYGVIFFEQATPQGAPPVKARPRIGSLVLVTVPGEIVRQGEIKSVSVTSTWFWPTRKLPVLPKRKVTARVVFYNSGNVHLTVKGSLTYKASFGWGAGKVEFNEITVLPKTTRYLQADIPDPPLVGSFKIKASVQYGPSLDVFDTTREATATFNMFPLSLLLLILLAIAVVVGLFLLRGWKKKRGASEESDEGAKKKARADKKKGSADEEEAEDRGKEEHAGANGRESEEEPDGLLEKQGPPEDEGTARDQEVKEIISPEIKKAQTVADEGEEPEGDAADAAPEGSGDEDGSGLPDGPAEDKSPKKNGAEGGAEDKPSRKWFKERRK